MKQKTSAKRIVALAIAALVARQPCVTAAPLREQAQLTYAPDVPPPITRHKPAIVEVHLESGRKLMPVHGTVKYEFWSFNGHTPGPFIRARVGDTLEIHVTNTDTNGMPHNCDFHATATRRGRSSVRALATRWKSMLRTPTPTGCRTTVISTQ